MRKSCDKCKHFLGYVRGNLPDYVSGERNGKCALKMGDWLKNNDYGFITVRYGCENFKEKSHFKIKII